MKKNRLPGGFFNKILRNMQENRGKNMIHNYMETIKKTKNKFAPGESRYCQSCGKESDELFEVNQAVKKIDQLHYCKECKDKNDRKS